MTLQERLVKQSIEPTGPLKVDSNSNMNYINLGGLSLTETTFEGVEFENTVMALTRFKVSTFKDCVFSKVLLDNTLFYHSRIEGCRFILHDANKKSLVFSNSTIGNCSITRNIELSPQPFRIEFDNCSTLHRSVFRYEDKADIRREFTTFYLLVMSYELVKKDAYTHPNFKITAEHLQGLAEGLDNFLNELLSHKASSKEDVVEHICQNLLNQWDSELISRQDVELVLNSHHAIECSFYECMWDVGIVQRKNNPLILSDIRFERALFNRVLAFNSLTAMDVQFKSCSFDASTLIGSEFVNCRFSSSRSSFIHTIFDYSKFENCWFQANRPNKLRFKSTRFLRSRFSNCCFLSVHFENIDLRQTNILDQSLNLCRFKNCLISFNQLKTASEFFDCSFDLLDHVDKKLSLSGDKWLFVDCRFESIKFIESTFHGVHFKNCRFRNCTFAHVSFEHCDLTGTIFDNCEFRFDRMTRNELERRIVNLPHEKSRSRYGIKNPEHLYLLSEERVIAFFENYDSLINRESRQFQQNRDASLKVISERRDNAVLFKYCTGVQTSCNYPRSL